MKIATVVGARPQFIKAAAVSRVLEKDHEEILVHTGQHYDANMSAVFFDELAIPRPKYNLGVGSGTHGRQTGEMLIKTEEILEKEKPDAVLVYGDTNSTLAGALAAAKLHIPVAHVEAGLRSFNRAMPEELNRVLTDHMSDWLFCPTATAVGNLKKEGVTQGVFVVGDVMADALRYYRGLSHERYAGTGAGPLSYLIPNGRKIGQRWYLATIHRAENTADTRTLSAVLAAFERLDAPVIFPVHPRTQKLVEELCARGSFKNIHFVQPVGYLQMIYLTAHAVKVVTDSGGLQKEAYVLHVPCVTVRPQTEWVETLVGGWNVLAKADTEDILRRISGTNVEESAHSDCYGDGHAAEKINSILKNLK